MDDGLVSRSGSCLLNDTKTALNIVSSGMREETRDEKSEKQVARLPRSLIALSRSELSLFLNRGIRGRNRYDLT